MKLFYCFYEKLWKQQISVKISLNLQFWCKNFAIVNHIGFPAVMAVKLKEHQRIERTSSNYLQASLIWSDGIVLAEKAKNMCFDWSNKCDDFCQSTNKCECACSDIFRDKIPGHFTWSKFAFRNYYFLAEITLKF